MRDTLSVERFEALKAITFSLPLKFSYIVNWWPGVFGI